MQTQTLHHEPLHHPPAWSSSALYRVLSAFPIATFSLTLVTDIAYLQTSNLLWLHFSEWLLFAGLIAGIGAAVVLAVLRLRHGDGPSGIAMGLGLVVLVLAALNSFIHTADGWTAVMPYGLATSIATVVVMIAAGWLASRRRTHV